jgi:multiple sugar transport system permease protein
MKTRTLLWFVAPSVALMLVFIALPLASVFWQSFFVTRTLFQEVTVESCQPGFLTQTCTTEVRSQPVLRDGKPVTERVFVGWENYRIVMQPDALVAAFSPGGNGWADVRQIDFWRALRFTLTFTLVTLPLVIGLGLAIALALNAALASIRGPIIFISLLPYIVTPVVGALSIRWLFIGDGILTAALRWLTGQNIIMFAQSWTIEILLLTYRVWHVAPFAFVVFYAALQTVNQDTLESAVVDGASRFERLRYVILPHLAPFMVFVALIHLMDAYRVFDEIVGFSAQAHPISLQWLTYSLLMPDGSGSRAIGRASASSMLTMIGIVALLVPLLVRTWRDHHQKG